VIIRVAFHLEDGQSSVDDPDGSLGRRHPAVDWDRVGSAGPISALIVVGVAVVRSIAAALESHGPTFDSTLRG
jgi:hypothetical protein